MVLVPQFVELLTSFREVLEIHLQTNQVNFSTDLNRPDSKFPNDCCKSTAMILGCFLIEKLRLRNVYYVNGHNKELGVHGWTQVDGHFIDLTADQFSIQNEKIILLPAYESNFHKKFLNQQRFSCSTLKEGNLKDVLSVVSDKISIMFDLPELAGQLAQPMASKEDLFFKYSKNLELVAELMYEDDKVSELRGKYICPICWRPFGVEDLDTRSKNPLTIEHIPPQSVGWKRKTLTCKECNNTQGSTVDSHLPQILNTIAFNKKIPGTSVICQFKVGTHTVNGTTTIAPDASYQFHFDESRSNPIAFREVKELMAEGNTPQIDLKWKTGDQKKALISMIRAAYLWGFAEFGYAFIYNSNFNAVRDQILNPEANNYFEKYVLSGSFPEDWQGLNVIEEPSDTEGYAFILNLKSAGINDEICVLLPAPDKNGVARLDRLRDLISRDKPDISFNGVRDPEAITHAEKCIYILVYWLEKYPID